MSAGNVPARMDATVRSEHAGVADQHVEPAEALDRDIHDRFDVSDLPDIGQQRLDRAWRSGKPFTVASSSGALTSLSTTSVSGSPANRARQRRAERPTRTRDRDNAVLLISHTSRYPPSTLSTVPVTNTDGTRRRQGTDTRRPGRWTLPNAVPRCVRARRLRARECSSTARPAASRTSRERRRSR